MGVCIRCTVRKAAKLALYDDIMISVKNAHIALINRTDGDLPGAISVPLRIRRHQSCIHVLYISITIISLFAI